MDQLTRPVAEAWGLELVFAERLVSLYRLAVAQGITRWRVRDGWRDPKVQEQVYAQGRTKPGPIVTNAKPWESAHQWGLSVDIDAASTVLSQLGQLAPMVGLEWGGLWRTQEFPKGDWPHFQLAEWKKHRNPARRA
jgi:peptidoglycan L-alanyl-D-glutamate endopeptidase CwlK